LRKVYLIYINIYVVCKGEGRRKKEEGRRKMAEGGRSKEEG